MPTTPKLSAISLADLAAVTGGCKKKEPPPAPPPQQAAPRGSGQTEITTNVQITGYGSGTTTAQ